MSCPKTSRGAGAVRPHDPEASCLSNEPYALMVLGDSMEPEFKEGDIIVIDPAGAVRDGAYVIAWHDNEHIFRQLRRIGDRWHILPLNHRYPSALLGGPEEIRGVVVQRKTPGQRGVRVAST